MIAPRFLIAAQASGSGKTMITCGVLQALVNRKMNVASFKCGPDYIDPMFHSRVIGTRSKNLDAFFVDNEVLKYIFGRSAAGMDISVIEGVMGFYDGISANSTVASSYDVSNKLSTPVILLINCSGSSVSSLAILKGFMSFRENNIKGVIFNKMSEKIFNALRPMVEEMGVKAIGYVPKMNDILVESRHLGLVLPSEVEELKNRLCELANRLEKTLDIDALIDIANNAPELEYTEPEVKKIKGHVRIGFANDDAFCFTYEDNIEILRRCGADIINFSPINDEKLPDVDAIVLSGGYPELHADALEQNRSMMDDIKEKIEGGMPCIAECGGFMYLHETMCDSDGKVHKMCGVIKGNTENCGKLVRFGYASFSPESNGTVGNNITVKGHEFHYWNSTDNGNSWVAVKTSGTEYKCIHDTGTMIAGYPHFYYYSNPELPYRFVKKAEEYKKQKK